MVYGPHAPQPVSGEPVSGHVINIDALYLLLLSVLHAPCSSQDYRLDLDHSRTYPTRRPPASPAPAPARPSVASSAPRKHARDTG